jgi:hypothetical protein
MSIYAEGDDSDENITVYARQISDYCDMIWERLRMDYVSKEGLKQAVITGDYIQYFYWDPNIKTGQEVKGDIATQLIDNVNYYPGNPNTPDVQKQPYIILIFRDHIDNVRAEAKINGVSDEQLELIKADSDNEYTSGDRGKIELDDSKINVLLKMYKKDGHVWCEKSTRSVVIQPEKDAQLTRYPLALMNWETRKNCCHGEAEVTYLIPNQVYINKIMALSQLSQINFAWPKVVYDRSRIKQWSNKLAGAFPVNGDPTTAAHYLTPPAISYDAWRGLDVTMDKTMRMMGANEVTLGSLKNPDNTSAFIAARDAAMVPLQSHQERFYAFIEDVGMIWMDFIRNFYRAGRKIPVEQDGKRAYVQIPENVLDSYEWKLKIEPGPSTTWGETQALQTMDNLLMKGGIALSEYLERIPNGRIPKLQELIKSVKAREGQAQQQQQPQQGQPQQAQGQTPAQQPDPRVVEVLQRLAEGIKTGQVQQDAAKAIAQMAQQGATFEQVMEGIKEAIGRGLISQSFLQNAA